MHLKEKAMAVRPTVERDNAREQQNRRIQDAATTSNKNVLMNLQAALCGLDEETVIHHRSQYGSNKVTHEKKKSLAKRLAGAFINPFTAILFCLALVSTLTDMIFQNRQWARYFWRTNENNARNISGCSQRSYSLKDDEYKA